MNKPDLFGLFDPFSEIRLRTIVIATNFRQKKNCNKIIPPIA